MYYIYIIECEGGLLYTGITTDIARRFAEHSEKSGKGAKYTRSHAVKRVAALWSAPDRSLASKLEYRLKHLTKSAKLELISHSREIRELWDEEFAENFSRAEIPASLRVTAK